MTSIVKKVNGRRREILQIILLLVILALPFALSVNGADSVGAPSGSEFTFDGDLTTGEVLLASTGITGSKHDFSFNSSLTPNGECSACHNIRIGEPLMWTRSLTEEAAYFNQTSNPNYLVAPTIYCYDCHDNHDTVDNDPDYRFFISESEGRYIPQDVAFDSNLTDKLAYNSTPLDSAIGFYETAPPNSVPPIDGRPTGGHYIKSNPSGLTNIKRGDKLSCTDCHEPHNSEPTNEVFIRGSAWFPLGGKVVSNLKASNNTRSGTGTGRSICVNCHGYNDTGTPVRFVDVNAAYGSTDTIIQTPQGVIEHVSANATACTDCHTHDANCGQCHGSPPYDQSHMTHHFEAIGPRITSCLDCHYFSSETHKNGDVNFGTDASANLTTTAACDTCHSPNGSYNGVNSVSGSVGAKDNWRTGVYSGGALTTGKEKWCAGCHDNEPAFSSSSLIQIILDEDEATYVGTWPLISGTCAYGGDFRYNDAGNGSETAIWTPNIPESGNYDVYVRWVANPNRASNAPYTVFYDGGNETVRVNQTINGCQWNLLGTYPFANGTSGYIQLTDSADGYLNADAILITIAGAVPSIYAPNVIGDNANYGFYATGHGAHGWVECLSCHNARTEHIDHEHRTYASASNNYQAGYRLAKPMVIPRPNRDDLYADLDDFALCNDCHNPYEVLGVDFYDENRTNFRADITPLQNGHNVHIEMEGDVFDSDWDWVVQDSTPTCIACHNVHGPPNQAMVRHGELMSTYGTTDKVPGLNFSYLTSLSPYYVYDTEADVKDSKASTLQWVDSSFAVNGICNGACHGTKTMIRAPYLGPKVLTKKADPNSVPADGTTEVLLTALVADHNDNVPSDGVAINLSSIGGGVETMYDDGINGGDLTAGDNIYSYNTTVPDIVASGFKSLQVTATDPDGMGEGTITLHVQALGEIVLDNTEATYTGTWPLVSNACAYDGDFQYNDAGTGSETATWRPYIPESGNYEVYVRWVNNPNRASNAPYTVFYSGGSATVYKDCRVNGCQWNLLGIYLFAAGTSGYIQLTDNADGYVNADAVKFVYVKPWLTPIAIYCSNLSNASALIDNSTTTVNTLDTGTGQYVVFDLGGNYTVTSIKMYTDGNNYTWRVSLGNDTSGPYCCNYSVLWGTLVLDDWQTPEYGWTETELPVPRTARYLKLMRTDGSGDLNASSLFEFMFDPPDVKLTYELRASADLNIYDPENRHVGMNYATGQIENEIPGAACHLGDVQTVSLPKLAVGEYRVLLKGTGTGGYELTVTGESEGAKIVNETFSGNITKNEMHDATTAVNTAEVTDATITVEDPPEPTVQTLSVDNVTLAGLYPEIDEVEVERITIEAVNTTSMPETVLGVHSAYMINATGSGEFALRFEDVEVAGGITAVYKIAQDDSWILLQSTVKGSAVELTLEAGERSTVVFTFTLGSVLFDTGAGTYPSAPGIHNGTIKPNQTIVVSTLYTYPCPGTGGHTEYVKIYNESKTMAETHWDGYSGDWRNISFDETFTLVANETYYYTIRTGSYPQIHHTSIRPTTNGWINCTDFTDANGKRYNDWIPAIKFFY